MVDARNANDRSTADWLKYLSTGWDKRIRHAEKSEAPESPRVRRLRFQSVLAELLHDRFDEEVGIQVIDTSKAGKLLIRPITVAARVAVAAGRDGLLEAIVFVEALHDSFMFRIVGYEPSSP